MATTQTVQHSGTYANLLTFPKSQQVLGVFSINNLNPRG